MNEDVSYDLPGTLMTEQQEPCQVKTLEARLEEVEKKIEELEKTVLLLWQYTAHI